MARLGKRSIFDEETIARARINVAKIKYNDQLMASISVLLAGTLNLTCGEIGAVFGIAKSTVVHMNTRFRRGKTKQWGGDRRSLLKSDAEATVLASLEKAAAAGEIVVVRHVKAALESAYGKEISLQTAYNVLHRHKWRKVDPDKEHPKADVEKRREFQKKLFPPRYIWLPPLRKLKEKS